jgi:josephin
MSLYHERQSLALCGVHAVNNLLQRKEYTKADFDVVCVSLSEDNTSWVNPHRSLLGIGDYDVNVVMLMLERHYSQKITWWDGRKELHEGDLGGCVGILWNTPSDSLLGWLLSGRHWIALLKVDDKWINLDSKLLEPQEIGSSKACLELLNSVRNNLHILLVKG